MFCGREREGGREEREGEDEEREGLRITGGEGEVVLSCIRISRVR